MSRKISAPKQKIIKKNDGDNIPVDFDFPSIGIEDIDRGLFDLFDKQLNFQTCPCCSGSKSLSSLQLEKDSL